MRLRSAFLTSLIFASACGSPQQPAPRTSPLESAAATITAADVHARVAYLASDELRGRDTPSPGLELAAAYIAREFESFGLQPLGDSGTFIQRYPLITGRLGTANARLDIGARGLVYGTEFFASAGTSESVDGTPVFVGRKIPASFTRGGVAVALLPGDAANRDWRARLSALRRGAQVAGADGLVIVLDPGMSAETFRRTGESMARPFRRLGGLNEVPTAYVAYDVARDAFSDAGLDLDAEWKQTAVSPRSLAGLDIRFHAPQAGMNTAYPPNVVAVLPGSDPALRDTYLIFSAHMDHVGVGMPDASGDSIYNGADDDASGTSALIEMAQAFAALPQAPARSVIFLTVSGEEKGLLGSAWYADHPTVPIGQIIANVNMDMVGRNAPDSIVVIGQEYSSLGPLIARVNAEHPELGLTVAQDIWPEQRFFFRSDHYNFVKKDIPALFFFNGVHEDYHRPSDELANLDTDKAARVAKLAFYTAYAIANDRQPPAWTEKGLADVRALTR